MATEDTPVQPPALRKTSFEGHWEERDTPRPPRDKPGWTLAFEDDFDHPRLRDKHWFTSYRAGRKDWFARMGIPSRFDDPDAHYVIEDSILRLRIDRDMPRRATSKSTTSVCTRRT